MDQDSGRGEAGARGVHGEGGSHEGTDGVERGYQEVPADRPQDHVHHRLIPRCGRDGGHGRLRAPSPL